MHKKRAWFFVSILFFLLVGCQKTEPVSSSSGLPDLYKAAIGKLAIMKEEEFRKDLQLDICDLSASVNQTQSTVTVTINDCQETLRLVDFMLVDQKELTEETDIVFPHYGLKYEEDFMVLVPNAAQGDHEVALSIEVVAPTNVLILFSYFKQEGISEKRIEHYYLYSVGSI